MEARGTPNKRIPQPARRPTHSRKDLQMCWDQLIWWSFWQKLLR